MVYRPLSGRVGYWLRQFSDTGERELPLIIDNIKRLGGGNCLCMKVADGSTWQGRNDEAGLTPIFSLEDVLRMRDYCHARGVTFLPVVVPRGADPVGEAAFHGRIADAVGALMTDIEPYPGFWDRGAWERIPDYTRALRKAAPNAYLINQPDPRGWARDAVRVVETAGDFDAIAAQHYVGWAGVGWFDVGLEVRRFEQLAALGREMYVTLWGTERTDLALAFWNRVREHTLGVNIFAFGPMDGRQLATFAAMPAPAVPPFAIDGAPTNPVIPEAKPVGKVGGFDAQLVGAIIAGAREQALPPDLLLAMGFVESGLNPDAVGDNGRSFGIFQIFVDAHGGDRTTWSGVDGARRAITEMSGRWQQAFVRCGGLGAWQADPVAFLNEFHPLAQGSVPLPAGQAQQCVADAQRVFAAWQAAIGAADGGPLSGVTRLQGTVVASIAARLRASPDPNADNVLDTIPRGAAVDLRREAFYPVIWNGQAGWMAGTLLTFNLPAAGADGVSPDGVTATVAAEHGINFRPAPDGGSDPIAIVPRDTVVRLQRDNFYPVTWNGQDGWVAGTLLALSART